MCRWVFPVWRWLANVECLHLWLWYCKCIYHQWSLSPIPWMLSWGNLYITTWSGRGHASLCLVSAGTCFLSVRSTLFWALKQLDDGNNCSPACTIGDASNCRFKMPYPPKRNDLSITDHSDTKGVAEMDVRGVEQVKRVCAYETDSMDFTIVTSTPRKVSWLLCDYGVQNMSWARENRDSLWI